MGRLHVTGKVLVNQASGNVKVVSKNGRLEFPIEVIETNTAVKKRVRNYSEFLRLVKRVRSKKNTRSVSKSMVIQERINMLLRNLHQPA